ncbi:TraY domain-containing protein [Thiotrichales bacterium 19S3-7]|nr:TraY domain-containing protein [Thiotrichales bacterium 19S3-7]MCF6802233.1 TraY domain-containing protein [Thiotrichales bacterium 19S3-11]
MYKYKTKSKGLSEVGISFNLDANLSERLSDMAIKKGRTKRMEAKLRLEDHIKKHITFDPSIEGIED